MNTGRNVMFTTMLSWIVSWPETEKEEHSISIQSYSMTGLRPVSQKERTPLWIYESEKWALCIYSAPQCTWVPPGYLEDPIPCIKASRGLQSDERFALQYARSCKHWQGVMTTLGVIVDVHSERQEAQGGDASRAHGSTCCECFGKYYTPESLNAEKKMNTILVELGFF